MAAIKITLAFTNDDQGWTESYYVNNPVPGTPANNFNLYAVPLLNARLLTLSENCNCTYVRIAIVGLPFAVQTFNVTEPGQYIAGQSVPNVAILVRVYPVTAGPSKAIYLHGIPHAVLTNGLYSSTIQFRAGIAALQTLFQTSQGGAQWGWFGVNQLTKVKCALLNYVIGEGGQIVLTFNPTITQTNIFTGVPIGTRTTVRLSGINTKSELNGVQVVLVGGPAVCQTVYQFGVLPYTHGGFGVYEPKQFVVAGSVQAEKAVTRKTGRPLFLARGRVPAKAKT